MFANLAPGTRGLLVACIAVFIAQYALPGVIDRWFALWPLGPMFAPWQILTYAFLHGGFSHLLFNMIGLVTFGNELERYWGTRRFLVFYFASVITAAIAQQWVTRSLGQDVPTVGASGGIYGLVLGFAMMFPQAQGRAPDPADPDAGLAVRAAVRGARALPRRHRHAERHRALRPPGRNGRRFPGDAVLEVRPALNAARAGPGHAGLSLPGADQAVRPLQISMRRQRPLRQRSSMLLPSSIA